MVLTTYLFIRKVWKFYELKIQSFNDELVELVDVQVKPKSENLY